MEKRMEALTKYIGYRLFKDGSRVVESYNPDREVELQQQGYKVHILNEDESNKFLDKDTPPPPTPLTAQDRWRNWALNRPLNFRL